MTNIQGISPNNSMQDAQAGTAGSVMKMALSNQKQEAQDIIKMINSVQMITDPALGNRINLLA